MPIALLTDFGTRDYFVGAMKGAILSVNSAAVIIDITHEIPAQDIRAASFTLRACYKNFPEKTIFVLVVDPGVGSDRRAILVETENYSFVAPDNGLLNFVFDEARKFSVCELTNPKFFAQTVSRTFHGRDIFAPVAAHLSKGVEAKELGAAIEDYIRLEISRPIKTNNQIEAAIIHADRFGNLVTNLTETDLPESFTLEVGGRTVNRLREFFTEAEAGELFLIRGSAGFLEIVCFQASAKEILRVAVGEKIRLRAN